MKNTKLIAQQIFKEAEKSRLGKGPWMIWFPKKTKKYISGPIKTKGDLQAIASWLTAETDNRNWHNTVFKDYSNVEYRGRRYSKYEGKILYNNLIINSDWDSVDMGSTEK